MTRSQAGKARVLAIAAALYMVIGACVVAYHLWLPQPVQDFSAFDCVRMQDGAFLPCRDTFHLPIHGQHI